MTKLDTKTKSAIAYLRGVANAPVLEVETAFAIASTLESATGQPIEMIQLDDVQKSSRQPQNRILVGTAKSNELIGKVQSQLPDARNGFVARLNSDLIVSGEDSLAVEHAGMDLLLRWWRNAKDSAARRVGLVEKELPRGGDATKLP